LIKHYKSNNPKYGYNLTSGGETTSGVIMSEAARQKMRDNHYDCSGTNHPLYGKKHSEETKKKISNKHKGMRVPEDVRNKMSIGRTGSKNGRARPVYSLELNEIFWGAKDAENTYGIRREDITKACAGRCKHAGRHPVTNEYLSWKYADINDAIYCLINSLNKIIQQGECKYENKNRVEAF